jgi:transcriptional regulator with XRE-family HTH domain
MTKRTHHNRKPIIGEAIKRGRIKKRMTALQVAQCLNVNRSTVFIWEKKDFIKPKNLQGLSETLDISMRLLKSLNAEKENA